jgi:hypothetical protein
MTQTFSTTATATFSETIRISNADTIALAMGATVTAAEAVNNLEYRKADGTTVAKCGLKITLSNGVVFGLFRWDLLPSLVEITEDGKLQKLTLTDTLHKAATDNLRTATGEEAWLKAIAAAVLTKTCGSKEFFFKTSKGVTKNGIVLTIG